jgi:hypothetical protein
MAGPFVQSILLIFDSRHDLTGLREHMASQVVCCDDRRCHEQTACQLQAPHVRVRRVR